MPRQQHVGNAAADAELVAQHAAGVVATALVHVVHDAPLRQLGERRQVEIPVPFGVKQRLMPVGPQFLDDRLDGGPIHVAENLRRDEGHPAAMHPVADGHQPLGIGRGLGHRVQVRHQGFTGGHHFVAAIEEVVHQAQVTAELVGENIHGRLEDARDGRHRSRFRAEPGDLRAESGEILHHRHSALEERQMVPLAGRLPGAATGAATRGSHTFKRKPVGSAISASYSSARMKAVVGEGSRY